MDFVGKVWKILVGIKDGLVLLFMLLFFIGLFALLSVRPHPGTVREGALLLALEGVVVEEKSLFDPVETLLSGTAPVSEYRARDILRALDAAATDPRIKVVVLDLSTFLGGGQVHLTEIGEALDRVRKAQKPVLAFARGYADDHMLLAAHASEVWLDPQGLAIIAGPGGTNLYYAELLDKLSIKAHVYRVGTFKSAVEPWSRNGMSEEARANIAGVLGALWEEYRANLARARPRLALGKVTGDVIGWIGAAGGDLADAALTAGLVDKLGDRIQFGERVAEIAGKPPGDETPGAFAASELDSYLADLGPPRGGKAIGVVTIAGEIVDGEAGPGIAGGKRIADMLDAALAQDLAALVVRVDSPGGSATAAEEIRRAIDRHRQRKIPVAVSFANLAASGGYWVAMASDRIFAQPATITGSIGVRRGSASGPMAIAPPRFRDSRTSSVAFRPRWTRCCKARSAPATATSSRWWPRAASSRPKRSRRLPKGGCGMAVRRARSGWSMPSAGLTMRSPGLRPRPGSRRTNGTRCSLARRTRAMIR